MMCKIKMKICSQRCVYCFQDEERKREREEEEKKSRRNKQMIQLNFINQQCSMEHEVLN